jgi:hypothetical protein
VAIAALLVLVIGGAVYAIVADWRRPAAALSGAEAARLRGHKKTAAGQKRNAA